MSPLPPATRIAILSKLAAARGLSDGRARDPLEYLAWVESGAPFEEAGVEGFLDGIPADLERASAEEVAELLELIRDTPRACLGDLYMRAAPRRDRHGRGEYYTSPWLVEHVLDRVGFGGDAGGALLDPTCGAGAFLTAAIARLARRRPGIAAQEIVGRVHGMDISPLAVLMARTSYLAALDGRARGRIAIPVALGDAIAGADADRPARQQYEFLTGNPPWIGWERLSASQRARTLPLWRRHGLFPDGGRGAGMQVMLGRGRKDLCMLATYAAAERFLKPGGRLAFVIARAVFKSVGGGAGFRRFVLGSGTPLKVLAVDDLGERRAFAGAASRAAVLTLEKGRSTAYPVPYVVWGPPGGRPREALAEPVDASDPTSAWLTGPRERIAALRRVLGASPYRARAGAYTGGANGVYWVERAPGGGVRNLQEAGRRPAPVVEASVEEELLFPLLRASDVRRLRAAPSASILLPQDPLRRRGIDEATMRRRYPLALAYLEMFREVLAARRDRGTRSLIQAGAPFYTLFSVSAETLSDWKVVWPRIAPRVTAAALGPAAGRPVIPQETCTFIACSGEEEACYLAGILNSDLFNEAAAAFAEAGGKSFGAPHLLRHIAVPRFDPVRPAHRDLASRVRELGPALPQAELDAAAADAWIGNIP